MTEHELAEGHGQIDISCKHGSRWIWGRNNIHCPEGAWAKVVLAPNCDCEDPPKPYKEIASSEENES